MERYVKALTLAIDRKFSGLNVNIRIFYILAFLDNLPLPISYFDQRFC
jgi:hypothetical protein